MLTMLSYSLTFKCRKSTVVILFVINAITVKLYGVIEETKSYQNLSLKSRLKINKLFQAKKHDQQFQKPNCIKIA